MKTLYYEDVEEGGEIPSLAKIATTRKVAEWAGATGNFDPLHYEDTFARAHGVERPIVHGAMKRAWLAQMLAHWIGETGTVRKLACYYIRVDYPRLMKTMTEPEEGDTWLCKGKVTRKYVEDGRNSVDCRIWLENAQGEVTTPGSATVILPSRGEA